MRKAGFSVDHDFPPVRIGFRNERDARIRAVANEVSDPLGAGPRFPGASAAEKKPDGPVGIRVPLLMRMRVEAPPDMVKRSLLDPRPAQRRVLSDRIQRRGVHVRDPVEPRSH